MTVLHGATTHLEDWHGAQEERDTTGTSDTP